MGVSPGGGGRVTVGKAGIRCRYLMTPEGCVGEGSPVNTLVDWLIPAALFDALGWEVTPNTFRGPAVGEAGLGAHQIMGSNHTDQLCNIPTCVPSLNLRLYLCKMQV